MVIVKLIQCSQTCAGRGKHVSSLQDGTTPPLSLARPLRPKVAGTLGRPCQVFANHFPVKCTLGEASHYNVEVVGKRKAQQDAEFGVEPKKPSRGGKASRGVKSLPTELLRWEIS